MPAPIQEVKTTSGASLKEFGHNSDDLLELFSVFLSTLSARLQDVYRIAILSQSRYMFPCRFEELFCSQTNSIQEARDMSKQTMLF